MQNKLTEIIYNLVNDESFRKNKLWNKLHYTGTVKKAFGEFNSLALPVVDTDDSDIIEVIRVCPPSNANGIESVNTVNLHTTCNIALHTLAQLVSERSMWIHENAFESADQLFLVISKLNAVATYCNTTPDVFIDEFYVHGNKYGISVDISLGTYFRSVVTDKVTVGFTLLNPKYVSEFATTTNGRLIALIKDSEDLFSTEIQHLNTTKTPIRLDIRSVVRAVPEPGKAEYHGFIPGCSLEEVAVDQVYLSTSTGKYFFKEEGFTNGERVSFEHQVF